MKVRVDSGYLVEVEDALRATGAMSGKEYLEHGDEVWDSVGSPKDDSHPISFWTKKAILEASRSRVSPVGFETLNCMRLEDLRSLFLRKDGVYLCGSPSGAGRMRHTVYYSLDFGFMREFLGGSA